MQYGMLLWPHANARYREAARALSENELSLLLRSRNICASVACERRWGADFLRFEAKENPGAVYEAVQGHSLMYLFFSMDSGILTPLGGRVHPRLGEDLTGILKYKGKTNEAFTRCLINFARCAAELPPQCRKRLIDPMCGRGTTLFEAANLGMDAVGADADAGELDEAQRFFKKYLETGRVKHEAEKLSLTLPGGGAARAWRVRYRPEDGETGELSLVYRDAAAAAQALGKDRFHLAVFDMPYGVQHAPGGKETFEKVLRDVLEGLKRILAPGGAVAFSFNTHTLKLETAREELARAGFLAQTQGPFSGNAHWVEQAIVRDLAVGVKPPRTAG